MTLKRILWIAALVLVAAGIVDFFDNNVLKLSGTWSLAIAFALLAYAQENIRKKMLTGIAYIFLCAAIAIFAYRLVDYYQG